MSLINNIGIGTDIETIDQFRNLNLIENKSFLNKIFTQNELDYCFSKQDSAHHLTARFSGKEAVIKAICSLYNEKLFYRDIEILNNEIGVPFVKLYNNKFNKLAIKISLSHCENKAIAFALVMEVKNHD